MGRDSWSLRRPGPTSQNPWAAAALALGLVAFAALVRWALQPALGGTYAFVTFYLAVIGAAALGGVVGFAVALVSALLAAWYLFVPPAFSFELSTHAESTAVLAFLLVAGLSGAVTTALRRALDRLDRAERQQRLLIDELNHRVKNTLATVQSLVAQTARSAGSLAEFEPVFAARLQALSRAHDVLTEESWSGAELGALVRQTLAVHDGEGRRSSVEGPPIRLGPNAAVTVNLAVHELAANAVQHGALSGPEGQVEVSWSTRGEGLDFVWRERCPQPVPSPARQGFGSRLLKAVARELNARVEPRHTPQGYAYHWRVPFSGQVGPA